MNIQLVGSDGNQLGGTPGMRGGLGRYVNTSIY